MKTYIKLNPHECFYCRCTEFKSVRPEYVKKDIITKKCQNCDNIIHIYLKDLEIAQIYQTNELMTVWDGRVSGKNWITNQSLEEQEAHRFRVKFIFN